MTTSLSWRERLDLAPHYLAVDQAHQYLWDAYDAPDDKGKPWQYVEEIVTDDGGLLVWMPGGKTVEVPHSIKFFAPHPSGLVFEWFVDIGEKDRSAVIHVERVRLLLSLLPTERLKQRLRDGVRKRVDAMRKAAVTNLAENQKIIDLADQAIALLEE